MNQPTVPSGGVSRERVRGCGCGVDVAVAVALGFFLVLVLLSTHVERFSSLFCMPDFSVLIIL